MAGLRTLHPRSKVVSLKSGESFPWLFKSLMAYNGVTRTARVSPAKGSVVSGGESDLSLEKGRVCAAKGRFSMTPIGTAVALFYLSLFADQ